jgi:hypothetical protein
LKNPLFEGVALCLLLIISIENGFFKGAYFFGNKKTPTKKLAFNKIF